MAGATARKNAKPKPQAASAKKGSPPAPFKEPPEVLQPFIDTLSSKHVYVAHIDSKPAAFKRKLFLVPIAMNIGVVALFALRMYYILPYYWKLMMSGFGNPNETTFPVESSTWAELGFEILKRGFTMFFDFLLFVFVWPWPVEFVAGVAHGNPTRWRWNVGFREKEIYVRRSRDWDVGLGDILKHDESRRIFTAYIQQATSPMLQEQKTGYLLMNGQWDLDWDAMVYAHALVDKKDIALDAFRTVVLVHHQDHGWLCYDTKLSSSAEEDEKRRQVFAFRDALAAMGKDKLFYRWVEIVQFESTQPGGFGPEKQEEAAKNIRELFLKDGVDFDKLWKETVGADSVTPI
ncbi:unnamed protein product [Clonostachys rosea f. rosea IK726]|jgi:hypothetical protein|uniref:Uncharacterized protein n=2 Tax=Bionectria ochroleuca TaxID=29856 RepID=A0A0B7JP73_BIOOC|nr:unnamed protein product [Clonostachys rosea f. rosea IK726]